MESDIVTSLLKLGYTGQVQDVSQLEVLLDPSASTSMVELSKLVSFLVLEIDSVFPMDDKVNAIERPDEADMFCMELSSVLSELYCPFSTLIEGSPSTRLASRDNRCKLLGFLISECQAARMIQTENQLQESTKPDKTPIAEQLRSTLMALGFGRPPPDITHQRLFDQMRLKIQQLRTTLPDPNYPGKPLLSVNLTEDQWSKLHLLLGELTKDYKLRREMLLARLDVTVLSFTWSSTVKNKLDDMTALFQPLRSDMIAEPSVNMSRLLAAREDMAFIEKTSSASVRVKTQTPLQKLVIGQVPDRGGRPMEHRIPAPEMPRWQKRQPDVGGGGGGRGGGHRGGHRGGGRGGGGRVQGGWNQGGSGWNQDQKPQWSGRGKR